MTGHRSLLAAAAAGAAAVAVAGCSAPGPAPGRSTVAAPAAASSPASTTSAGTPTSSAPPVPSPAVTSTAPTTSAPPPSVATATAAPAPAQPRSTCTSLTVRVIRGSAAPGYEFAALQFVNTGSTRCVLYGYPQATLRLSGSTIGSPSSPAGSAASQFSLDPGAVAESRLQDFSSCQAPLSDEITVTAPGSSISAVRPAQLRACALRVSPLGAPG